jgi:hypothetical protein
MGIENGKDSENVKKTETKKTYAPKIPRNSCLIKKTLHNR